MLLLSKRVLCGIPHNRTPWGVGQVWVSVGVGLFGFGGGFSFGLGVWGFLAGFCACVLLLLLFSDCLH